MRTLRIVLAVVGVTCGIVLATSCGVPGFGWFMAGFNASLLMIAVGEALGVNYG